MEILASALEKGQIVVALSAPPGQSPAEASVYSVTRMASGTAVTLDTDFGLVERVYEYDEKVNVK